MINFRDREAVVPSVVSVLSLIVMVGAFGFMTFVKPPTAKSIQDKANKAQFSLKKEAKTAAETLAVTQAPIANLTWTGDPEYIGTTALETVTALALKHGVKLSVFRTQRATLVDNLVTLPYVLSVEGSFVGTLALARDIEDTKTKLAVTEIQMSSSDPNSDKVSANIGIIAYVNPSQSISIDASSSLQSRKHSAKSGWEKKNA